MIGLVYSFIILSYICYIYVLVLTKKTINYPKYNQPFSVIIPCYNEEYNHLNGCMNSIMEAEGNKQIILVDNNSNSPETLKAIEEYQKNPNILVLKETRQGKRFAHSKGLKYTKNEIIVFVDSDTIVKNNSFIELIKPFQNENVGGGLWKYKANQQKKKYFDKIYRCHVLDKFSFT